MTSLCLPDWPVTGWPSAKIPLMNDIIQTIAVYALPVIFAITLHEAAHAYAAKYFGDPYRELSPPFRIAHNELISIAALLFY